MRDKLFLTGARQIGKSTAIDAVLSQLSCRVGGFRTGFSDAGHTELCLRVLNSGETAVVMHREASGARTVYTQVFDTLGAAALDCDAALLLADELGFLERDAAAFQAAVQRALDGGTPMLGVLREDEHGWLDVVRGHPRVRLFEVTAENRDSIPAQLLELLAGFGLR